MAPFKGSDAVASSSVKSLHVIHVNATRSNALAGACTQALAHTHIHITHEHLKGARGSSGFQRDYEKA